MKNFTTATIKKVLNNAAITFTYVDGQSSSTHILVGFSSKSDALAIEMELDMAGYFVSLGAGSVKVLKGSKHT